MSEIWKEVTLYEGLYEASSFGRVRSVDKYVGHKHGGKAFKKGRLLKQSLDKDGYLQVSLSKKSQNKTHKVHRIIASLFLEKNNMNEVNHKNLIKTDNSINNLEWVTRKQNQVHASSKNIFNARNNIKRSKKLNKCIVDEIKTKRKEGNTYKQIGEFFSISPTTAFLICKEIIWK